MSRVDTTAPSPPTWRTDEILLGILQHASAIAPWVLEFAANDGATWAHVGLGGVAIGPAVTWLKLARRP